MATALWTCIGRASAAFVGPRGASIYTHAISRVCQSRNSLQCHNWLQFQVQRLLHKTSQCRDLYEFFDHKDNWPEKEVKVGRPWKLDELRLKSNTDLHKLWYVLLKERNMLMTMEAEYTRLCELFPSPERLDKVEESMENLLDVVDERDKACNLLENGYKDGPGTRQSVNKLGIEFVRRKTEKYIPYDHPSNRGLHLSERQYKWQGRFLRLLREKEIKRADYRKIRTEQRKKKLKEIFPHADIED